ncbi:MAG TPA: hypothetical protein VMY41_06725 [Thermohalobaculum sp.]|nr:hypothetical protein [Thermohalobaculum sp.]
MMRELIEEGRDAIGDTCGLTLRLSLDETIGDLGFANSVVRDMIEMHSDLPGLWDLAHGVRVDCSGPSRFSEEGAQQSLVEGVKPLALKTIAHMDQRPVMHYNSNWTTRWGLTSLTSLAVGRLVRRFKSLRVGSFVRIGSGRQDPHRGR